MISSSPIVAPVARAECPLADLNIKSSEIDSSKCPFHQHNHSKLHEPLVQEEILLSVVNSTHQVSAATAQLLHDIGGGDKIRELCTRFYARAFLDDRVKPFFFMEDGATAHGKRLADWIIEKMGGEGKPWSNSGRFGMRQPSHHRAWNNVKRAPSDRGNHFDLIDARVWMRLHFWAARELGLHQHAVFWDWYGQFIRHFIRVYEGSAVHFVREDANWSASTQNIAAYLNHEYKMVDLVGRE